VQSVAAWRGLNGVVTGSLGRLETIDLAVGMFAAEIFALNSEVISQKKQWRRFRYLP
jgi:hypothetical protein